MALSKVGNNLQLMPTDRITPRFNVVQLLAPANSFISISGQLMLLATKTDIDLSKKPPLGGFKFLKHPESSRACMIQIAGDSYKAFQNAQDNMENILLHSRKILNILQTFSDILEKGSPRSAKILGPIQMKSLEKAAGECLKQAEIAEESFEQVMSEIEELLESIMSTQGHHEQELEAMKRRRRVADEQKTNLEKEHLENMKMIKKQEKSIDEAFEAYKKACAKTPSVPQPPNKQDTDIMWKATGVILATVSVGFGLGLGAFLIAESLIAALAIGGVSAVSTTVIGGFIADEEKQADVTKTMGMESDVQQLAAALQNEREMYNIACKNLKEKSEKLRQFIEETSKLDTKKMDLNEIIGHLRKNVECLSEIKKQWSEVVNFIKGFYNIITFSINKFAENVVQLMQVSPDLDGNCDEYLKKFVQTLISESSDIAKELIKISTIYVQVSRKDIISRTAGLSRLLSYDPENEEEIRRAMLAISHDFNTTQNDIETSMQQNRIEFNQKVDERLKALTLSPGEDRT